MTGGSVIIAFSLLLCAIVGAQNLGVRITKDLKVHGDIHSSNLVAVNVSTTTMNVDGELQAQSVR